MTAAIEGNEILAKKINVIVHDNWTEFGAAALQYARKRLAEGEDEKGWWTYFPVYKKDNTLIGSGGYKGKPGIDGVVEIRYEIAEPYRNRGLATEMTQALIENAVKDGRVSSVIAHTLGQTNPSTRVLEKCNFEKVEEMNDPDEGIVWKWSLNVSRKQ